MFEDVKLPLTELVWHLPYSEYNTFIYATQDTLNFSGSVDPLLTHIEP